MTSKERISTIISGGVPDRCGFWLGHPKEESWTMYRDYFGVATNEAVRQLLQDDYRWVPVGYKHPEGRAMFPLKKLTHGTPGPFVDIDDPADIESYPWPDPRYVDFAGFEAALAQVDHERLFIAGGFWSQFYHFIMDLFGMETYMMHMLMRPDLVHAVTDRVCGLLYEMNGRFFEKMGDKIDAFFFGNDFGTQRDLICGPDQFDEFIMPWFSKFTSLAHSFGLKVVLHSCGSIHKVIGRIADAGVECLHPLQAKADNMAAETIAKFKGRIAFLGGIDTQDLLVNGTPAAVRADVRRVVALLGPNLIISPSHEAVLPNISPENIEAMADLSLRTYTAGPGGDDDSR